MSREEAEEHGRLLIEHNNQALANYSAQRDKTITERAQLTQKIDLIESLMAGLVETNRLIELAIERRQTSEGHDSAGCSEGESERPEQCAVGDRPSRN